MSRPVHTMYRIALYGRSSSGKSCWLGAMAVCGASSRDLTCERLPVVVPAPDGNGSSGAAPAAYEPLASEEPAAEAQAASSGADHDARALHRGQQWLDQIVEALTNGQVPQANRAVFDGIAPTVDWKVGAPHRGDFLVRMIDYSGELLNPHDLHDPDSFASKLKRFLQQSDGFLVLAETPRAGESTLPGELIRLREAFASLSESKYEPLTTPVAVVLTKWDRYSTIDPTAPDDELPKVAQFLEQYQEYAALVSSISNALVPQDELVRRLQRDHDDGLERSPTASTAGFAEQIGPALQEPSAAVQTDQTASPTPAVPSDVAPPRWGLQRGHCWVFPASSFGRARQHDNAELPHGKLRPFGILEPITWIADRRDQLDTAALHDRWQKLRLWSWLPLAWLFPATRSARQRGRQLTQRIPEVSPIARRARSLRSAMRRAAWVSCASLLVLFAAMGAAIHSKLESHPFQAQIALADSPQSTIDQLKDTRRWFDEYSRRPVVFPWIPSRSQAEQARARIDQRLDELF
jgi:hypothetical protein